MAPFVRLWFSDGRVMVEGCGDRLGLSERDARRRCFVAGARSYGALLEAARRERVAVDDEIAPLLARPALSLPGGPPPDGRLLDLLWAADLHGGSALLRLPRGRLRGALAQLLVASAPLSSALVCRGDEAERWRAGLSLALGREVGGEPGLCAVVAAEEAPGWMLRHGHRVGLLLVDGADEVDEGALELALGCCVAPRVIGVARGAALGATEGEGPIGPLAGELLVEPRSAPLVRLYATLSAAERRDFEGAVRAHSSGQRAAWLRGWSIAALPGSKREKLREIVARHRGRRVVVLGAPPAGARAPALLDLIDELPLPSRAEYVAMERASRLRFCSAHDLPPTGLAADVVLITGGPGEATLRSVRAAAGAGATIFDLRSSGTQEDPCWRWPLWQGVGDADEEGEGGDP